MADIDINNKSKKENLPAPTLRRGKQAGVKIHPTSVIDEEACLGEGVEIGPYCTIAKNVSGNEVI